MSESNENTDPANQPAAEPDAVAQPVDPAPADAAASHPAASVAAPPPPDAPAPPASSDGSGGSRWRDRSFRLRSVAAVALAGVILGAAGGATTAALVSGDGDHGDRHRIGNSQHGPGGVPGLPPGGRPGFGDPLDSDEDGDLPEMPEPPDSDDGGTDEQGDTSQG